MAVSSPKIIVKQSIQWTPASGESILGTVAETFIQQGTAAIEKTQNFTATTSKLDLGDVAGDKYLMVRNTDTTNTLYVDVATPVVPSAAPHKIPPGKGIMVLTAQDNWYAITSAGTIQAVITSVNP